MQYLIIYVAVCLVIGICGINRKLGFWGYFLGAILLTPPLGIILLLVSDARDSVSDRTRQRLSLHERGAMDYARDQAVAAYRDRIDALIQTGRISQQYANEQLEGLMRNLRRKLEFDAAGRPSSPLDSVLTALERLPAPPAPAETAAATREGDADSPRGEQEATEPSCDGQEQTAAGIDSPEATTRQPAAE